MIAATSRRCVLAGSEPLLVECAKILLDRGHEIAAIVSRRAEIGLWARQHAIALIDDANALPDAPIGAFDDLYSITNLSVLSPRILALPTGHAINFHDGPLPAYAGLNAPVWALLAGERRHGVSWHRMDAAIDTGDILAERDFAIDEGETAHSINTKCFAAAIDSFGELVAAIERGALSPRRQSEAPARYFGRSHRPALAATIDWNRPAREIETLVRALDHGGHANPLGAPKLLVDGTMLLVGGIAIESHGSLDRPGTVLRVEPAGIVVATATTDVMLTALSLATGEPVTPADAAAIGLCPGTCLAAPLGETAQALGTLDSAAARYEGWWRSRLIARSPLVPPGMTGVSSGAAAVSHHASAAPLRILLAATVAYLARVADRESFDIGLEEPVLAAQVADAADWFARQLPLGVSVDFSAGIGVLADDIASRIGEMRRRIGHARDLFARTPALSGTPAALPVALSISDDPRHVTAIPGTALTIAIAADGSGSCWHHDPAVIGTDIVARMQQGLSVLIDAAIATPDMPIGLLPLLSDEEQHRVVHQWNGTRDDAPVEALIHDLFAAHAARMPDAPAITSRGQTLSYARLDARSDRLARHLRARGVGAGTLVGIHVERGCDLIVAVLAVHKAGGAYLPLDPGYPAERLAHMIADSGVPLILSQSAIADRLAAGSASVVRVDAEITTADGDAVPPASPPSPDDLAYVIYTSGSTGLPKGVMVEHRSLLNFLTGMDRVIEPGGTWLAVTSLSFDISVLELLCTLARGCHVVIATGDEMTRAASPRRRKLDFSLFYFASADAGDTAGQYRLLLDGARFADNHGFSAIWTPERHFHAFGGLYPNPSVTSAAIAAITHRVQIRGGSVVVPLHHPIRVAEEWSLVDNLSNGRVGIAFASGWQPNDFVLRPENFADKNAALMNGIDTVRALWRGETRAFAGPLGKDVEIAVYPRPVQAELPFWITSAGNPDTFRAAGQAGAFVLTHLLGQTAAELGQKLAVYRDAWKAAGHPGEGHVTLMLHTLVGEDADEVRAMARGPLIEYLRSSTNLVKEYAWSFPAFKRRAGMAEAAGQVDLASLDEQEMAGLLDHSFERYYATGGLFGTPEQCLGIVDQLRAVGVDEIACLIDFGVPAQQVLDHLPALDTLRRLACDGDGEDTLAGLMTRHRVTHLQCTPSMARMLVADESARPALAALHQMLVGGEAFPPALADELVSLVGGQVLNMYGPTETTIWSAVHRLDGAHGDRVPLGRPLANQQVYILDRRGQLVQPGFPGELVIGGAGVVRGYLARPELTAERFVTHPFDPGARAYRTSDLARHRIDGTIEFLGRIDHQVKIRGHRIELGEIEAVLARHPLVSQTVVLAREDAPGDVRLVAYYTAVASASPDPAALRDHLRAHLPEAMVPAHLMVLAALPQTPNGKVDRAALPAPDSVTPLVAHPAFVAPATAVEERIADAWRDVLKLPSIGTRDNFFDIGGHSLLAVQLHRSLRERFDRPIALTDIFRFPTIEALAAHLSADAPVDAAGLEGQARAIGRRAALSRRREMRLPVAAAKGA